MSSHGNDSPNVSKRWHWVAWQTDIVNLSASSQSSKVLIGRTPALSSDRVVGFDWKARLMELPQRLTCTMGQEDTHPGGAVSTWVSNEPKIVPRGGRGRGGGGLRVWLPDAWRTAAPLLSGPLKCLRGGPLTCLLACALLCLLAGPLSCPLACLLLDGSVGSEGGPGWLVDGAVALDVGTPTVPVSKGKLGVPGQLDNGVGPLLGAGAPLRRTGAPGQPLCSTPPDLLEGLDQLPYGVVFRGAAIPIDRP